MYHGKNNHPFLFQNQRASKSFCLRIIKFEAGTNQGSKFTPGREGRDYIVEILALMQGCGSGSKNSWLLDPDQYYKLIMVQSLRRREGRDYIIEILALMQSCGSGSMAKYSWIRIFSCT